MLMSNLHEVLLSLHCHQLDSHASGHLQQHRCDLTTASSACLLSCAHHYHVVYLSLPLNARYHSQCRAHTFSLLYSLAVLADSHLC